MFEVGLLPILSDWFSGYTFWTQKHLFFFLKNMLSSPIKCMPCFLIKTNFRLLSENQETQFDIKDEALVSPNPHFNPTSIN